MIKCVYTCFALTKPNNIKMRMKKKHYFDSYNFLMCLYLCVYVCVCVFVACALLVALALIMFMSCNIITARLPSTKLDKNHFWIDFILPMLLLLFYLVSLMFHPFHVQITTIARA